MNQVVSLVEAGTRLEKVCVYEHSSESSLWLCISLHGPFRKPWMISYDYHALVVRSQVEYKKKGANGQNMHLNPSINALLLFPTSSPLSNALFWFLLEQISRLCIQYFLGLFLAWRDRRTVSSRYKSRIWTPDRKKKIFHCKWHSNLFAIVLL